MRFELIDLGGSRSVAAGDALLNLAATGADTTLVIGGDAQARAGALGQIELAAKRAVLVELGTECLAFHTGEDVPVEEKVLGFAVPAGRAAGLRIGRTGPPAAHVRGGAGGGAGLVRTSGAAGERLCGRAGTHRGQPVAALPEFGAARRR